MGRLGRLLLVVAIALAHGAVGWWLMQGRERPAEDEVVAPPPPPLAPDTATEPSVDPPPAPSEPVADAPPTRADATPARPTVPPLPPIDTPLAQMLPELEARAARGDTAASCRLAVEGERCLHHNFSEFAVEMLETHAAAARTAPDAFLVDSIARLEDDAARSSRMCAGVPTGWAEDNTWRHKRAAAAAYPGMAVQYALSPSLLSGLKDVQEDAWAQYRADAPGLLRNAAQAGDLRALFILQRAYNGEPPPHLSEAIAIDAAQALVYAMVLLPFAADAETAAVLQQQIEAGHMAFDDAAWSALQTQADAITKRHFSRQAPIDFSTRALKPFDPQMCEAP